MSLKPGIIPFRPLTVGDFFDGAFKAMRFSPAVMFVYSAIVVTITTVLSILVQRSLTPADDSALVVYNDAGDVIRDVLPTGVASAFQLLLSFVLGGVLAFVVSRAILGWRVSIGRTWEAVAPRMPAILGASCISLLIIAVPVAWAFLMTLGGVALAFTLGLPGIVLAVLFWVRFVFAPVIAALEKASIATSLRRSWQLTRGAFWRTFGILTLVGLVVSVVSVPIGIGFAPVVLAGSEASWVALLAQGVSTIAIATLTSPFSASATCLLYVDRRIRAEGFDIELARSVAV